jgi:hypothetical protein
VREPDTEAEAVPGGRRLASVSRENRQAEPAEVLVEREAGHAVEQRRDDDEGDRVAEGEAVIATMFPWKVI